MEHLAQPLAVAFGSAAGSIFREAAEVSRSAILRNASIFGRLFGTAACSALAGFLAAYMSPLDTDHSLIPQALAADLIGGFLVGLLGGFVILPSLVPRRVRFAPTASDQVRRTILYIVGSLIVTIVFFILGAVLCRIAL